MVEIPTREPEILRAGDTWQWTRSLADFPAPTWEVVYSFVNKGASFEITAAASGTDHSVDEKPTFTKTIEQGRYKWVAVATSGADRFQAGEGWLTVEADFAKQGAGFDVRTTPRQILDAIEAVILERASLDQEEMNVEGNSLKRTPMADLILLRDKYSAIVKRDEAAEKMSQGKGNPFKSYVRFGG